MKKNVKIGIIGAGYWGKNLVRNFAELGVLAVICDSNPDNLAQMRAQYPKVKLTESSVRVFSDKDISAVVISTPAVTHYELAQKALKNGKHVFVEKPLALDLAHAEGLISLAKKKNRVLMVGHLLEYHPAVVKLKEIIDSGGLGKINYIYSNRLNLGKVRNEENILWSFAPHDISVIRMLIGEEPSEVTSIGANYLNPEVADITVSNLNFKSGVKAHIFVSWLHPFKEQRLVVIGDKKMAVFEDSAKDKLKIYDQGFVWKNRIPVPRKDGETVISYNDQEPLKLECLHFIDSITNNSTPKTDGISGFKVLKVLKACQESLENSGMPVKISPLADSTPYFVHPSAVIDKPCEIGDGTKIWHYSHIMRGARIGKNCSIGQNVNIASRAKIGNNVKIQNNISIYDEIVLEDDVFCGPSAVFTNVINPRSFVSRKNEYKKTLIQKGATIGANATIICGNTIGRYAFIGAGAVVTKDIPDYALAFGNPATVKGWMCACGVKLKFPSYKAKCTTCGKSYKKNANQIKLS